MISFCSFQVDTTCLILYPSTNYQALALFILEHIQLIFTEGWILIRPFHVAAVLDPELNTVACGWELKPQAFLSEGR